LKIPADPKSRQFLQLNRYRRERQTVHVYLLSGTRFTGRIRSFDVHTLLLETQQGEMVIYTHAISTIEQALPQRGARRPAGGGMPRRAEGGAPGPGRFGERSERSPLLANRRSWDAEAMPDSDPDVELPRTPVRTAPAAPTVTIVRRRSRLVPPRSTE
jgi:host factor-I protein